MTDRALDAAETITRYCGVVDASVSVGIVDPYYRDGTTTEKKTYYIFGTRGQSNTTVLQLASRVKGE